MFKIVVLICSLALTPNTVDCTEKTAVQKLETPSFTNSLKCNTGEWESWLSKLAIKPNLKKEYPRIKCQRVKDSEQ